MSARFPPRTIRIGEFPPMFFANIMTLSRVDSSGPREKPDRSFQVQLTGARRNKTHDDALSNYPATECEAFSCRDGLLSTCRAFRERRHGDRLRARKIGLETDHGAAKICGDNQPSSHTLKEVGDCFRVGAMRERTMQR
jgi:hypothetical protein